jgi:hypothetical protein
MTRVNVARGRLKTDAPQRLDVFTLEDGEHFSLVVVALGAIVLHLLQQQGRLPLVFDDADGRHHAVEAEVHGDAQLQVFRGGQDAGAVRAVSRVEVFEVIDLPRQLKRGLLKMVSVVVRDFSAVARRREGEQGQPGQEVWREAGRAPTPSARAVEERGRQHA